MAGLLDFTLDGVTFDGSSYYQKVNGEEVLILPRLEGRNMIRAILGVRGRRGAFEFSYDRTQHRGTFMGETGDATFQAVNVDGRFFFATSGVFMTTSTAARPGRNEFCRCGSGRKYKHCCLTKDDKQAAAARATSLADAPAQSSEDVTSISKRAPKPRTDQPWKGSATRGFVPRSRTPRKVGGG